MDISEKDFNNLVLAVTEKVLLRLPDVLGTLMMNHAEINKLNKKLYTDYPEFKDHPDCVSSVIQMIERSDPSLSHEQVIQKSIDEIKKRIGLTQQLNCSTVQEKDKLNLNISNEFNGSNGEI